MYMFTCIYIYIYVYIAVYSVYIHICNYVYGGFYFVAVPRMGWFPRGSRRKTGTQNRLRNGRKMVIRRV